VRTRSRIVLALAFFWTIGPARVDGVNGKDPPKFQPTEDEQRILELTNQARQKEKRAPLKPNALLGAVARAHSENMARQGKMEHVLDGKNPAQRVEAAGYDYASVGENIAYGTVPVEKIFHSWMESPHHKENILKGGYQEIGIGAFRDAKGVVYYTQVFGTRRPRR
jgi:uncharacterized protein YkwD